MSGYFFNTTEGYGVTCLKEEQDNTVAVQQQPGPGHGVHQRYHSRRRLTGQGCTLDSLCEREIYFAPGRKIKYLEL